MEKSKNKDSAYRMARKQASELNDKFKSMEGASEVLGVSKDSLLNYELGLCKQVPVDIVCKMADIYNAPELLNHYCYSECPIGKFTVAPVNKENIENIYKIAVNIVNILGEGNEMGKKLLDIVKDGKITKDEIPVVDYLFNNLQMLNGLSREFEIAIIKMRNKED